MSKKLFMLYFVAVSFLAPLVLFLPAHAEPAHCFMGDLDGSGSLIRTVDCSEIAAVIIGGPQENQCYYEVGFPPPQTAAASSSTCKQWLQDGNSVANTAARCVAVNGTMSDWSAGKITELTKYNVNAKCSDYYGKLTTNGGGDPSYFHNGACFLIFKTADSAKFDSTFGDCNQLLVSVVTHQKAAAPGDVVPTNPDRDKVIHCGEHGESTADCIKANPLIQTISRIVDFISAGIGIIVVIMVIIGGIQYITAGNNPQAVTAAKKRITNALIALVAFLLLFAFMNWLLPGGLL